MNKQCICNREYEREGWQACRHILLHVSWCPMSVNYRAPKSIFQKIADFFNPNRMTKPELIAELGRRIRKIEHPDLTDEEALRRELTLRDCRFVISGDQTNHNAVCTTTAYHPDDPMRNLYFSFLESNGYGITTDALFFDSARLDKTFSGIDQILGLPITLPRVLAALPDGYKLTNFKATNLAGGYWVQICDRWGEDDEICCWLLTKIGLKSSRDCTADDQSEETLKALIDLFPKNDN